MGGPRFEQQAMGALARDQPVALQAIERRLHEAGRIRDQALDLADVRVDLLTALTAHQLAGGHQRSPANRANQAMRRRTPPPHHDVSGSSSPLAVTNSARPAHLRLLLLGLASIGLLVASILTLRTSDDAPQRLARPRPLPSAEPASSAEPDSRALSLPSGATPHISCQDAQRVAAFLQRELAAPPIVP